MAGVTGLGIPDGYPACPMKDEHQARHFGHRSSTPKETEPGRVMQDFSKRNLVDMANNHPFRSLHLTLSMNAPEVNSCRDPAFSQQSILSAPLFRPSWLEQVIGFETLSRITSEKLPTSKSAGTGNTEIQLFRDIPRRSKLGSGGAR
ncbi:predicted protein [Coccidioides posadasii str. Silveira]|uniref:Predicted protein n=1 Tax=Coccidioides posadasii (strain RMSCC 757 / Silveira) TaxID=443226 RepID=E9DB12_COCPS|nr:predicted protein [Coccidioides posadasii str. Silveira]